jgi:hypothetical protein
VSPDSDALESYLFDRTVVVWDVESARALSERARRPSGAPSRILEQAHMGALQLCVRRQEQCVGVPDKHVRMKVN